jgi:LCP family protein required for cell wall assembly
VTVNRQYVPSNNSEDDAPDQKSASDSWLTAGSGLLPSTPPVVLQHPVGKGSKGLLSSYKNSQMLQSANGANSTPGSVVEQDTLQQPAIRGGSIEPVATPVHLQQLSWGQVSPHQSGISALPVMPANAHQAPGFVPESMPGNPAPNSLPPQPYVAQPFSPLPGTLNQQAYPPAGSMPVQIPVPGQTPGGWQGQAMGYQGYQGQGPGGGPPFVQGPGGEGEKNGRRKKKRRFPIWARIAVAMLVFFIILGGTGFYYYEANFAAPVSNIVGQTAPLLKGEDNPNLARGNSGDILSGGRINILLLGSDTDQKFQNGYLAQTDIVVTIDPSTKSVGMLSIPRDLYINVPGYGMMKLDEAFYYGDAYNHNGVGLSRLTISQDFGIPINYYAWVGLSGFIKVVDTAGGVDIDVTHPITDDIYPDDTVNSKDTFAYKRLYLAPGPQHLDGPTALEYVRSRHADLVGDFGRSARQQQMLSSLKTRLVNSNIISKLPELAKDMNGYLKTDMQILDIIKLMNFARTIDPAKIQRIILSPPTYSSAAVATSGHDTGEDIFNPICGPIQQAIAKMFALGNNARCNVLGNGNNSTSPVLAQAKQPPGLAVSTAATTTSSWRTASQLASMNLQGTSADDPFGMRSLLDLLLLVVFESPVALQF